jgi:ankyrin repeat protein
VESLSKKPNKELIRAARRGDIGGIRAALQDGAAPNWKNAALVEAAKGGHLAAMVYLLDLGANPNYKKPPILAAAEAGQAEAISLLLERGARLYKNCDKMALASLNGHFNVVKMLLDLGERAYPEALQSAVANNHFNIVKILIEHNVNVNYCDTYWNPRSPFWRHFYYFHERELRDASVLHVATELGHAEIARLLIEHGANPDNLIPETRAKLEALLAADAGKPAETEPRPEKI